MKKYVAKSETRPVLQLVQFDGKYFTATDSHHLIRVNAEYVTDFPENLKETFLYDPKEDTAKGVQYNYPDTSRLIPQYSDSTVLLNKNIKEFHNHVKEIKKVVKKDRNKVMKIAFKQNETLVSGNNEENSYSAAINNMHVEGAEITLHVSSNYLNIALDAVKKLSKLSSNHVEIGMTGHMRPMHFKQEGIFDIMVLPVRKY
jgi:hypothetical protein